jgi:peptidoglycan/LPS O-acetylase OafA/YrhL
VTRAWFRRWGWTHLPVSPQGWLVILLLLVFWIQVFLAVDRRSHSVSDTLYGIFPFVVPSFLLFEWVASRTSGSSH